MKVLSIGTDSKIFEDGSVVLERQKEYASKLDELHMVVFTNEGFKERQIGNLYLYPTNSKIFSLLIGGLKIRKILEDKKGFVITTQDSFETGFLGVVTKKIYNLPLQVQIHTDFLSPYFINTFLNRLRVYISKLVIPNADEIRVVSSVIQDSLVEKYSYLKSKIDILPIWVDTAVTYFDKKDDSVLKILVVSRLEKEKKVNVALDVFKKVSNKFNNLELLIAGDGSLRDKLEEQANILGIRDKVNFLGWTDNVSKLFVDSHVYLLTSEFEGYGMTLLQAGSFGTPIVTTKVGVAKTDLFKDGENSYVCPVGDVDCLSDKLLKLLENENTRKTFSQNMKESIEKITISREEYVTRYISLLSKLIK
jgi:glycosyltransferase involved in cell wall biosynthesis